MQELGNPFPHKITRALPTGARASAYGNGLAFTHVLALSPELDLARTRNITEYHRIVRGLITVGGCDGGNQGPWKCLSTAWIGERPGPCALPHTQRCRGRVERRVFAEASGGAPCLTLAYLALPQVAVLSKRVPVIPDLPCEVRGTRSHAQKAQPALRMFPWLPLLLPRAILPLLLAPTPLHNLLGFTRASYLAPVPCPHAHCYPDGLDSRGGRGRGGAAQGQAVPGARLPDQLQVGG